MEDPAALGGRRARPPLPREDVVDAVKMCETPFPHDQEMLKGALYIVSRHLGLPDIDGDYTCATIAEAVGAEWQQARDLLLREQEIDAVARTALAEFYRLPPARRGDAMDAQEAIVRVPGPSSAQVSASWSVLPNEMRAEVIQRLTDVDPSTVLSLYETDRNAHALIDDLTHALYGITNEGQIGESRIPLIEYARVAAALGESQPLRVLLASALCTLKALANVEVEASKSTGQFSEGPVYALVENHTVPITADGKTGAFSSLIESNLFPTLLDLDPYAVGYAFPGMDLASIRSLTEGPLPGDLPDVVRQWYEWLTKPADVLAETRPPIAARYMMTLRWRPDYADSEYDEPRPFLSNMIMDDAVQAGTTPIDRGVPVADDDEVLDRMRYLGEFTHDEVQGAIGQYVRPTVLDVWIKSRNWSQASRDMARRLVEQHVNANRDDVAKALLRLVGDRVRGALPPGKCAALADRGVDLAPFEFLFLPSPLWMVPASNGGVHIYAALWSPVLENLINTMGHQ